MAAKKQSNKKTTAKSKTAVRTRAKRKSPQPQKPRLSPRIKSILYVALAIIFGVMVFIPGSNVWTAIRSFFFGIFGLGMLLIPAFFIYMTVMNEKERYVAHFEAKVALCVLTILFAGAFIYMLGGAKHQDMNYFAALGNLYLDAFNDTGYIPLVCGLIGGILGYPLAFFCGSTVALILTIVALAVLIFILTNLSVKDVARAASRTMDRAKRAGEEQRRRYRERMEQRRQRDEEERRQREQEEYINDRYATDFPQYTPSNTGAIDIPLDSPKKKRRKRKDMPEEKVEQSNTEVDYSDSNEGNASELDLSTDLINIISRAERSYDHNTDSTVEHIADDISQEKRSQHISQGAVQADPETVPVEVPKREPPKKPAEPAAELSEFDNAGYKAEQPVEEKKVYHYPPIQLLRLNENNNDLSAREELEQNSRKLVDTLQSFGVNAKIVNICRGPSVTRYELQPAPGVKISKITNLSDDIALNLAANGVRIEAPIPGKAAVGIEVPNKVVSMV